MPWTAPKVTLLHKCEPGERMRLLKGFGDAVAIVVHPDRQPMVIYADGRKITHWPLIPAAVYVGGP